MGGDTGLGIEGMKKNSNGKDKSINLGKDWVKIYGKGITANFLKMPEYLLVLLSLNWPFRQTSKWSRFVSVTLLNFNKTFVNRRISSKGGE